MVSYRRVLVYQKALQWLLDVYRLCRTFPDYEKFALTSQIRRAAVSVTSNIAEGMSRSSDREIVHFLEISYGSLMEVQSQLEVAQLLNYLSKDSLDDVDPKTEEIAKMLSGLKKSKMR